MVLPTAKMGLDFTFQKEGKFLRRELVLAITEDDSLHTEEVQRLWDLVKDVLPPNRLLNVAIDLLQSSLEKV